MSKLKRFLEISADGIARHEPSLHSPFSMGKQIPPKEVWFCPCAGIGVICHHVYDAVEDAPERHLSVHGPHAEEQHQDDWKAQHVGPRCRPYRQFFVDVTDRPDVQLGMRYDEATNTFSKV